MTNGRVEGRPIRLPELVMPKLPGPARGSSLLPRWSLLITLALVVMAGLVGTGYLLRSEASEPSGAFFSPPPLPAENPTLFPWASPDVRSPTIPPGAVARYVDCSNNGPQDGSAEHPWHSLDALGGAAVPEGAIVLLRRGCSWPGGLRINRGSTGARVEAYGAGSAPVLTGEGVDRTRGVIAVEADDVRLTGLHVTGAAGAGVQLRGAGAHVDDLEIDQAAFGVEVLAPGAMISRTRAHDLHMYINTPGGSDDTGAVGFTVQADDATIRESSCINCRAPSHDFGHDGGFVEIYNHGDRLRLVGNTATNIAGIIEIGGIAQDGGAQNVVIERNTFRDAHGGFWVHRDDQFTIPVDNIAVIGNTVVNSTAEPVIGGDLASLNLVGNVFAAPGPISTSGAPGTHTRNRYYLVRTGSLGYPTDPSETVAPASAFREGLTTPNSGESSP